MDSLPATELTPLLSLVGGLLIGASSVAYLLFIGRRTGISGISAEIIGLLVPSKPKGGGTPTIPDAISLTFFRHVCTSLYIIHTDISLDFVTILVILIN